MTNKEINTFIKKSGSRTFLENIKIELNFKLVDTSIKFDNFIELLNYIKRQQKGWNKIEIEIPLILNESKEYFNEFYNDLISCVKSDDVEYDWKIINRNYINHSNRYSKHSDKSIFTFDSPITSFLIDLFNEDEEIFKGGYDFLFGNIDKFMFDEKNYLIGINKAYEFEQQTPEKILKRSRYERSNLSRLRNDFETFIIKSNTTINNLFNEIEELKKIKQKDFDKWFNKIIKQEDKRYADTLENDNKYSKYSINRSKELEDLYSEKLMLSKPAEYWDKRAKELKNESKKWLYLLLLASVISVTILVFLIIKISNETLVHLFSNVGSAIRWSILLISIISFLAFAIRIFSKLTLSSYHLARDAEERKQLVYVYLSLKNQKAVSENERILILQSIFSRSDTGLLKEDSSPTMPSSSIIEKIISNK